MLVVFERKTGRITTQSIDELPDYLDDEVCYANNAKADKRCGYLKGREPIYAKELRDGVGTFAVPSGGLAISQWMMDLLNIRYLSLFTPEKMEPPYGKMFEQGRSWKEYYKIPEPPSDKVIAIGTQAVKALESYAITGKAEGESDLLITPGYIFKIIKGLLTAFHYPKGPLVALTAALIGVEQCREVYKYALDNKAKFVEFGDRLLVI